MPPSSKLLRNLVLASGAVLLLGLVCTLPFPSPGSVPVPDEAGYLMLTQSLWHDHDLGYAPEDLSRAFQLWPGGPRGLALVSPDGGETLRYGSSWVYPMVMLPFYGLLGVRGMVLGNLLLLAALVALGIAWWRGRPGGEGGFGELFAAAFVLASALPASVLRLQPELLIAVALLGPLAVWQLLAERVHWQRRHFVLLAASGAALGVAAALRPWTLLFAVAIVADLLRRGRGRELSLLVAPLLVTLAVLLAPQHRDLGVWGAGVSAGTGQRLFEESFPLEKGPGWEAGQPVTSASWTVERHERRLAFGLESLLVGRHSGIVPYFPFTFLALALFLASPRDRPRTLLLLALAAYCAAHLLQYQTADAAAVFSALGDPAFAAVYPAFLLLPGRLRWRPALLLPLAAAALWTAALVPSELGAGAAHPGRPLHTRLAAFELLPPELTALADQAPPGYWQGDWGGLVWLLPRDAFFVGEGHPDGVWMRGASRAEVILVSPVELDELRLSVQSLAGDNTFTLAAGDQQLRVRFDTEAKRQGTPLELPLYRTRARYLGGYFPDRGQFYYRLHLATTSGLVPQRHDPSSHDPRYLGVFLDLRGEP